jgi:hypothetical protein
VTGKFQASLLVDLSLIFSSLEFESLSPPKNDAYGPEQVGGAIIAAPPCKVSSKFQSFNRSRQAVDLIEFFSVTS